MVQTAEPVEGVRFVDLSDAHPEGVQVTLESPATGIIVVERDFECQIARIQNRDVAIDAARGTVRQNIAYQTPEGSVQPAEPLESVWVFNEAGPPGAELKLAYFIGHQIRQGTDRFSPDFVGRPEVLFADDVSEPVGGSRQTVITLNGLRRFSTIESWCFNAFDNSTSTPSVDYEWLDDEGNVVLSQEFDLTTIDLDGGGSKRTDDVVTDTLRFILDGTGSTNAVQADEYTIEGQPA